jgi:hypothetical protein
MIFIFLLPLNLNIMKKLLLLFALLVSGSCTEKEDPEPDQGYTSFAFLLEEDTNVLKAAMSAYYNEAGECKLLCEYGDLIPFVETDEFIMPEYHDAIYLFYKGGFRGEGMRLAASFKPQKGKRNKFVLSVAALGYEGVLGIEIDEKTIYTWPH